MPEHKFDVDDAVKHGVEKAILLEHLKYHQASNHGKPEYTFDGKTWSYIKPSTMDKMFCYLNPRSMRRWLLQLEKDGVIESFKPFVKSGNHLKYYHVIGFGQNDQRDKKIEIEQDQGLPSFLTHLLKLNEKSDLLEFFKKYRSQKRNPLTPIESELMMDDWKDKSVDEVRNAIIYTCRKGWFGLRFPESDHPDELLTQKEVFAWLQKHNVDTSRMEDYFELTDKKRGKLALWKKR